jgi:integrase
MWKKKVNEIMESACSRRVDGKVASERTQTLTKEVVYAAIRLLHELGYRIQEPKNLGERHIDVLVKHWWYCKHKKIKTIQNELSRLRVFCSKLGKPGMVGAVEKYLPDVDPKCLKVRTAAQASKAWSGHGVDMTAKFREVDERDQRLGLMLRMELAFGLRREEVLKCNPHIQDFGHYLQVFPGTGKGGRPRNIPIASVAQRALLDYVKERASKSQELGWRYSEAGHVATLEQNTRRYENLMAALGFTKADIGVTGHGLRAQFAENQALVLGLIPSTMGGDSGQMASADIGVLKGKLAQALGHNRPSVIHAYIGSLKQPSRNQIDDPCQQAIQKVLCVLRAAGLPEVPAGRIDDCRTIQAEMQSAGVDLNAGQVHILWAKHARRNGVEWMAPEGEIAIALRISASAMLNELLMN